MQGLKQGWLRFVKQDKRNYKIKSTLMVTQEQKNLCAEHEFSSVEIRCSSSHTNPDTHLFLYIELLPQSRNNKKDW